VRTLKSSTVDDAHGRYCGHVLADSVWVHPDSRDDPIAIVEGFRKFVNFALDPSRHR
jgi:hypothetical protein